MKNRRKRNAEKLTSKWQKKGISWRKIGKKMGLNYEKTSKENATNGREKKTVNNSQKLPKMGKKSVNHWVFVILNKLA